MNTLARHHRPLRARRGSVYLIVLATTTVIATLVGGTVYAQGQRLRAERASANASKARLAAESGIEFVRAYVRQDPTWRTTFSSGRWVSNVELGEVLVDLDVVDPVDGNLANHPYHSVEITSTARVGDAEQIMKATLVAKPTPIDALQYAVFTGGQLYVASSGRLLIGTATAVMNQSLKNDAVIEGNVRAATVSTAGQVWGTLTNGAATTAVPSTTAAEAVALLGTTLTANSIYANATLSPASNPFGATNSRGVYVIRSTGDIELDNITVNGTLVIISPGKVVKFRNNISVTPTSPDLPAMIVNANADFEDSAAGTIAGLVHVTGTFASKSDIVTRGALLVGATTNSAAIRMDSPQTIYYSPSLYEYPPVGYAKSVDMALQPGSYRRVVR